MGVKSDDPSINGETLCPPSPLERAEVTNWRVCHRVWIKRGLENSVLEQNVKSKQIESLLLGYTLFDNNFKRKERAFGYYTQMV